jgi:hypothetical protein
MPTCNTMDFSFHYGDWILGQFYYGRQVLLVGGGEKRGEKKGGETNPKVAGNLEFLIFLDFFYINFA